MPGSMPTSAAPDQLFLTYTFLPIRHQNIPGPVRSVRQSSGRPIPSPAARGLTAACPSRRRARSRQSRAWCSSSLSIALASPRNWREIFFQSMPLEPKKCPHSFSSSPRAKRTSAT
jgi:hypothetical protein